MSLRIKQTYDNCGHGQFDDGAYHAVLLFASKNIPHSLSMKLNSSRFSCRVKMLAEPLYGAGSLRVMMRRLDRPPKSAIPAPRSNLSLDQAALPASNFRNGSIASDQASRRHVRNTPDRVGPDGRAGSARRAMCGHKLPLAIAAHSTAPVVLRLAGWQPAQPTIVPRSSAIDVGYGSWLCGSGPDSEVPPIRFRKTLFPCDPRRRSLLESSWRSRTRRRDFIAGFGNTEET